GWFGCHCSRRPIGSPSLPVGTMIFSNTLLASHRENEMTDVTLDTLVGEHVLDAVDTFVDRVKQYSWSDELEEASVIRFRLDGVAYTAIEDPSDGYRSS